MTTICYFCTSCSNRYVQYDIIPVSMLGTETYQGEQVAGGQTTRTLGAN